MPATHDSTPDTPALLEESLAIWSNCSPAPVPFGRTYSAAEQADRESHLARFLDALQSELQHPPRTARDRHRLHARITTAFAEFARSALGFDQRHLDLMLDGGFSAIGTTLARRARGLDPQVTVADIFQANRNAWTACGLQMLYGRAMSLTPSIFAYSMLYPYTDNYFDQPSTDAGAKRSFGIRFGARLAGEEVAPVNDRESVIWKLIGMIEGEYERTAYPQVYLSLMAIERAQAASVRLLRDAGAGEVLRLVFNKGGTSVLADAFLAAGSLTPSQARFAFNWGVLLQLADDIQDVAEDRSGRVRTLFSQAVEPLDQLTGRTLTFGMRVMEMMNGLPGSQSPALQELIARSCFSLIVRSAGDARELYTSAYIGELEERSPFRFDVLAAQGRRFARSSGMLVRVFEAFLSGNPDEPAFPILPSSLMPRF